MWSWMIWKQTEIQPLKFIDRVKAQPWKFGVQLVVLKTKNAVKIFRKFGNAFAARWVGSEASVGRPVTGAVGAVGVLKAKRSGGTNLQQMPVM